jgi:serine/threonine protein kinase
MDTKPSRMVTLSPIWKAATADYQFLKLIGVGSYGEVVHAKHRLTGKTVAIKLIKDILKKEYDLKKIVREVQILRHFS